MIQHAWVKNLVLVGALLTSHSDAFGAANDVEQLKKLVTLLHAEVQGLKASQIGLIETFAGTAVPNGYLPCDGRMVTKASYPTLFAKLGYTYGGTADSFRLPDLRGQFLRGWSGMGAGPTATVDANRSLGTTQPFATSASGIDTRTDLIGPAAIEAFDGNNWYSVNSGGHQWSTEGGTVGIPSVRHGSFGNDGQAYPWGGATENLNHGQGRHVYFHVRSGTWKTVLNGAPETRPTNVAAQFIIRAQ
ncbi:MAG TPA: phage tail protein [Oligoflexus sp.]|uniref:phage tail protein n=1 Tax=Oligoflexus sp. TaxID=1971216 RepID=UPI002D3A211B|nr:phage tail protein [Oligoflexus sp.]HYX32903.1 phage tail protein [Oligoflexus sp.]